MKKNIIAISREFGSGGRTIGRLVAQKLGIQFYDRDIIKKVVEESGLTRKYVEHYGEFAPSADQRFAYSFVGLDEDSNSPLVQLWKTREKVIKDFATAKPCVIVGSCADYILRDREDCLKVFLYADEETKENRIQEIYGEAGLKLHRRRQYMAWPQLWRYGPQQGGSNGYAGDRHKLSCRSGLPVEAGDPCRGDVLNRYAKNSGQLFLPGCTCRP